MKQWDSSLAMAPELDMRLSMRGVSLILWPDYQPISSTYIIGIRQREFLGFAAAGGL